MRPVVPFAALGAALLIAPLASAVEPTVVVETAARLDSRKINVTRAFPADGQVLSRDGMEATFEEGRFFPVERSDGRVVGLVFDGVGYVRYAIPEGIETAAWQAATDFAPLEVAIGAGCLRFSDSTLDDLQGEREWVDAKDPSGGNFRLFEARTGVLENPLWTRWASHLVIDQLSDLYAGGHVGGHLLAEFRIAGGTEWTSYLHNPRGALLPGETTAVYRVRSVGDAPPEVDILASWGGSPEAAKTYDISSIDIDISFPTPGGPSNRNMVDGVVKAELEIVAIRPDRPLKAVVLELESQRLLCTAESDRERIKVNKVTDGDGNSLAAIHRGNRLLIPLASSLQPGQSVTLTIEYAGAMTQGIALEGRPDTYFSPLGPWAWYPRNPQLDRFGSRVEVHLPRYMRAVAPGDLTEERKEKEGWHFVFEEPSGVRTLTLVVGDMLVSPEGEQGANPRIMVWLGAGNEKDLRGSVAPVRSMVDFVASIWGPYPYSTLHVVENVPFPAGNWSSTGGASGKWSCVPPGQVHPWQGWVDGSSGLLLGTSPTTAPSKTVPESRVIDRFLVDPVEVGKYVRLTDLTRQWWGHMIPPASPRDTWINEGLVHWTGLIFTRAAIGDGAMKERLQTMQREMIAYSDLTGPLALGERLGSDFAPQAWGRSPLLINWLVDRLDAQVFGTAMRNLINRGSARGVDAELLIEVVGTFGDSGLADQLRAAIETNDLAEVTYNTVIDKGAGDVAIIFSQSEESFIPVDIPVQLVIGAKDKQDRIVHLNEPVTTVRWHLETLPKRVVVDPRNTSLTSTLKKDKDLVPAAAEGAEQ